MSLKNKLGILTIVLLLTIASACASPDSVTSDNESAYIKINYGPDYGIEWSDAAFEAAVRIALDKPSGTIMRSELDHVTHFEIWGDSFAIFNDSAPEYSSSSKETYSLGTGGVFYTSNNIVSLEDCSHFKALDSLKITNNNNLDVSHLGKYTTKLNSLELLNNNIVHSEALSTISTLTNLVLVDIGVFDVNVLGPLKQLECLEIGGGNLNDISALQHLSSLKQLKIDKIKFEIIDLEPNDFDIDTEAELLDIRVLSKLKQLEELSLSGEAFSNIDVVGNISNLRHLELNYVNSDISSIGKLSNLKFLHLGYINSDYDFVSKLHGLEELNLLGYSLPNLDPLASLSNMKILTIYDAAITNLDALSALGNLEELVIYGAESLHDINGLSELVNLKNLIFHHTSISNISSISGLTNLQELSISSNHNLGNIEALSTLTNLKRLQLDRTKISDISALRNLNQLTSLNIENTQVSNIDALENMNQLQNLYIQNTNIIDTSVLSKLPQLKNVYPKEAMPISASSEESSLQTSNGTKKEEYSIEDFLEKPLSNVVDLFGHNYAVEMGNGAPGLYYPNGEIEMMFYTGEDISDSTPSSFLKEVSIISVFEGQVIPGLHVGESATEISEKVNLIISTPEYDEYTNGYYMVGIHKVNGHDYALVFNFQSPTSQCRSVFVKLAKEYGIPY